MVSPKYVVRDYVWRTSGVHNVSRLICHRHGLSTGESSRDRHERRIFWRSFLHRFGLCQRRMLAELMGLLEPVLKAPATEAESFGLEVNWQKTMLQALGNIQDAPFRHSVGARG